MAFCTAFAHWGYLKMATIVLAWIYDATGVLSFYYLRLYLVFMFLFVVHFSQLLKFAKGDNRPAFTVRNLFSPPSPWTPRQNEIKRESSVLMLATSLLAACNEHQPHLKTHSFNSIRGCWGCRTQSKNSPIADLIICYFLTSCRKYNLAMVLRVAWKREKEGNLIK